MSRRFYDYRPRHDSFKRTLSINVNERMIW